MTDGGRDGRRHGGRRRRAEASDRRDRNQTPRVQADGRGGVHAPGGFISPEVKQRNGSSSRVEFETIEADRGSIPDEYTNPDRAFTVSYQDDAVLGTFAQHMRAEERIRGGSTTESAIGASHIPPEY